MTAEKPDEDMSALAKGGRQNFFGFILRLVARLPFLFIAGRAAAYGPAALGRFASALVVVELGLITPPVGMNVFVISALATDTPMSETFKGVVPYFLAELVRVALILSFPAIALWLPRLLSG